MTSESRILGREKRVGHVIRKLIERDGFGDAPLGSVEGNDGLSVSVNNFGRRLPRARRELRVDPVSIPAERSGRGARKHEKAGEDDEGCTGAHDP